MTLTESLLAQAERRSRALAEEIARGRRLPLDTARLTGIETEAEEILALLRSARILGEVEPGRQAKLPSDGTKRARLIAWLCEPEGVTRDEILAAFDWKPGTLSAVLSGLRRDGYQVERSRDRGSGSSRYRISTGGE